MGRKGSWFSAVKKALSPNQSKEKKEKRKLRTKSKLLSRETSKNSTISEPKPSTEEAVVSVLVEPTSPTISDIIKLTQAQNEQNKHVYSVALATAAAAEAAVAAAQAAAEIVRLTSVAGFPNMKPMVNDEPEMAAVEPPKDEPKMAAVKIQSAYRGYKARMESKRLKGILRLKTMVGSKSVKRQAMTTLKCMQTLAHVQSQVQARRIQMTEENLALKKESPESNSSSPKSCSSKEQSVPKMVSKLHDHVNEDMGSPQSLKKQKMQSKLHDQARVIKIRERELNDQDWIGSPQSKEQMDAMMMSKQEAAIKRERALAYSYSHQQTWRNQSSKKETPTTQDSKTPEWEWNWLDKWVIGLPCQTQGVCEKDDDHSSVHSSGRHANNGQNSHLRRHSCNSSPRSKPLNGVKRTENTSDNEGTSPTNRTHSNNSSPKSVRARNAAPSPLGNATPEKNRRANKSLSFSTSSHTRHSSFSSTKSIPTKNVIMVQ